MWLAFLYYGASLLSLFLILWARGVAGETNLPPLTPFVRIVTNLLYFNLAISLVGLLRTVKKIKVPGWAWVLFFTAGLLLCAMPPIFSGDLMEYLIRGRILGIYGQSPYQHVPQEFPTDLLFRYSTWQNNPDSYGPLFVLIESLPAIFFPGSIWGMATMLKVLIFVITFLGILVFWRIAKEMRPSSHCESFCLYALNPLLIVSTFIDGHNDAVMVSFSIISFYHLWQKKFSRAFLFWTLAFLVKYTVLLILPFWVLYAVKSKQEEKGRFPWSFCLKEIFWNIALIVAAFAPLWAGKATFLALIRASEWFYTNTIPYVVWQALGWMKIPVRPALLKTLFLAGYALFYSILLYRFWRGTMNRLSFIRTLCLAYLVFYLTITIPFGYRYLLWALPWLVLSEWPLSTMLVVTYSFTGLFSYFKRINYLILIGGFLYAVFYGWNRWFKKPSARGY